jgi:uncharacterized protein
MLAKVSLIEIPALDFDRAVDFYTQVFGFSVESYCGEDEKMGMIASDNVRMAISQAKTFLPSEQGVLISLEVADIDEILSKVTNLNCKILHQKTKIEVEGMGWFAIFLDSESNRIGLYQD